MPRYRKVSTVIWNDQKFRSLSDKGQLVFLFLMTHPHMTSLGAMRGTIEGLCKELGKWPIKAFTEAFQEAIAKGMAEYDEDASFIALPNFLKHNPPESPNVIKSWSHGWEDLPECRLKVVLQQRVAKFVESLSKGFQKAFESLSEAFRKGMPYQEQEQEQEQEQKQKQEQETKPAGAGSVPAKLLELIDGWNELPRNIAKSRVDREPPIKAVLLKWNAAMREPKKRESLADIPAVLAAIRKAAFCHGKGWFTLPWLFGNNQNGEFNIVKLMNGGHDDGGSGKTTREIGPGQKYDPNAVGGEF